MRIVWPLPSASPLLLLWGFALLLTSGMTAPAARSQTPLRNPGAGSSTLPDGWRFHVGDDAAWAANTLDDTHWQPIRADAPWGAQGHPGYAGFAWYRRRLDVTGPGPAPALYLPPVDDAYEVFWNGEKIGSYGRMPPRPSWFEYGHGVVYALPATADGSLHGELALRVWKAPFYLLDDATGGGFEDAPVLGDPAVLDLLRRAPEDAFAVSTLPRLTTALLLLIAGLAAGALWWASRQALYGWLAGYLVSAGAYSLMWLPPTHFGWSATANQFCTLLFGAFGEPCLWFLFLSIFGLAGDRRWRRATLVATALYAAASLGDCVVVLLWAHSGGGLRWADDVLSWAATVIPLYSLAIVVFGLRSRRPLALWPLAAAVVLFELYGFLVTCSQQVIYMGSNLFALLTAPHLTFGPYRLSIHTQLELLLSLVLIVTVAQVHARQRQRQAVLELELKSAREVQQVLIPEEPPTVPGFAIATAYQPAEEVGGDFFQVIPTPDGLLVVLGDVSGKGLAAAMTVSLIVGTLRTLAEVDPSPTAVLAGLNRRLLGRTRGGFATCLAVLVRPDGALHLANAGHLSPFLNGGELEVPSALPLGITPDLELSEASHWLRPGDTLTLYTDGLLEARNGKKELFGFERVAHLLARRPHPNEIMEIACRFGQEDDITVLTLTRLPVANTLPAFAEAFPLGSLTEPTAS